MKDFVSLFDLMLQKRFQKVLMSLFILMLQKRLQKVLMSLFVFLLQKRLQKELMSLLKEPPPGVTVDVEGGEGKLTE